MSAVPERPLRLEICSAPAHLPVVRAAVGKMCELLGFDEKTIGAIVLSVDEALTNIIRHAYDNMPDRKIEVELAPRVGDEVALKVVLRDYGRSVDRSQIKSRDLQDVRPGGLGVHIMTECMDSVEYEQANGKGTVLTMTKKVSSSKEPPSSSRCYCRMIALSHEPLPAPTCYHRPGPPASRV